MIHQLESFPSSQRSLDEVFHAINVPETLKPAPFSWQKHYTVRAKENYKTKVQR